MSELYNANGVIISKNGDILQMSCKAAQVSYSLETGLMDIYRPGGLPKPDITAIFAEIDINGTKIANTSMRRGIDGASPYSWEDINDALGKGIKVSIKNMGDGISLTQQFYLYPGWGHIVLELLAEGINGGKIYSNYIAPIATDKGLEISGSKDPRFLFVPFDNDDFIRYASLPLREAKESYSVTAVFDNDTRRGLVAGAITHDTWKTGITLSDGKLRVFGGITSYHTRDTSPHGKVGGACAASPKIYLGFYDDWRDGMEAYGKTVGEISPPLSWGDGVPFGWNSWSAVATQINYDIYVEASDFVKDFLQNNSFHNNGVVYINFDSFWDRLTVEERIKAANHVKANGQRPGIYFTPFTFWDVKNPDRIVEGTDGKYKYSEIITKNANNEFLPSFSGGGDGGFPLDPTHPGNKMRVKHAFDQFLEWGFEYIKLDFMCHASVEGVFHDPAVTTGIQAYNCGMSHILEILGDRVKDEEFFISLSIAPIFPSQYAHGRRISCDIFGTINWTEYMLNSLTYGWWLNNHVYPFNDPDHIVTYNSFNHREAIMYNEGLSRYVSAAISGTFMIDSDDFRLAEARERAKKILTHEAVNRLAAEGKTFKPVEGNTGDRAADIFVREDGDSFYLAVFNFDGEKPKKMRVDLARAGLDAAKSYTAENLLDGGKISIEGGFFDIDLDIAEPKIFKLN